MVGGQRVLLMAFWVRGKVCGSTGWYRAELGIRSFEEFILISLSLVLTN